jgi:hypothetical protein
VPEISVEGDLPLEEAVVLDRVGDAEILREAVLAALARPEVSAVVVTEENRDLLELDLTKLTYG